MTRDNAPMKFTIDRDTLADAVTWVARSLPNKAPVPALSGMLLEVIDGTLCLSAFDYMTSARESIGADVTEPGSVLVSGRLLADIVRALPAKPVEVELVDTRVTVRCGPSKFTLLTMPVDEYPTLPAMPDEVGTIDGATLAEAVAQVTVAASRDDTLPVLTGVRVVIEGETLTMLATDRYRCAVRTLPWSGKPGVALVPARTLTEVAKSAGLGDVTLCLDHAGHGLLGVRAGMRQSTSLLIDGEYPRVMSLFPAGFASHAIVDRVSLSEAVKRAAIVAERNTPVRLTFADGTLTITAGQGEDAQADESMDCAGDVTGFSICFNPSFLLDGLGALSHPFARLSFTLPTKPAVLTGQPAEDSEDDGTYRYLLMPVRATG